MVKQAHTYVVCLLVIVGPNRKWRNLEEHRPMAHGNDGDDVLCRALQRGGESSHPRCASEASEFPNELNISPKT